MEQTSGEGLNQGEMDQVLPDGSTDQVLPPARDMDDYLRDADIVGFNDDYVDFMENVDQMVRDAEGYDEYSDGEFAKFQKLV